MDIVAQINKPSIELLAKLIKLKELQQERTGLLDAWFKNLLSYEQFDVLSKEVDLEIENL